MKQIVDLTLSLAPGMRGVDCTPACTLARDGWNASTLHLYSHCGTHMDAAPHFGVAGHAIDEFPLEHCMATAWVVDLAGIAPRTAIGVEHLGNIARRLRRGQGLLLHTGWSAFVSRPLYRDALPPVSRELARWCVEHGVRLLGVEPPSVADVNDLEELAAVHRLLLEGGVTIIEGLTNLEALTQKKVAFMAFPLKIAGGDGSPVRAVAFEERRKPSRMRRS